MAKPTRVQDTDEEIFEFQGKPTRPRAIGYWFKRPLTTEELDAVRAAAARRGKNGGPAGGLVALWDLMLGEAHGVTWQQSIDRGTKFHPAEFAIPKEQSAEVYSILMRYSRRVGWKPSAVGMLWLDIGPGSYDPT